MDNLFSPKERTLLTISFSQLKPACDQLITNLSKENVNQLFQVLTDTPALAIEKLTHYILLPIELHMRNESLKWELKLNLVKCLKCVLQKSALDDTKKIQNLYTLLFVLLSKGNGPENLFIESEEFLIEVLDCVTVLMTSAEVSGLYHMQNHAMLSFGVYKCVLIIKYVKANLVKVSAFHCLLALTQTHSQCQSKPKKQELVALIRKMLPGIISSCSQTVAVGALQHHSVVIAAVQVWSKIITLVMRDDTECTHVSIESLRKAWERNDEKCLDEWTSMADSKLKITTNVITAARHHPHWKARLEIASACGAVLSTCRKNLASSVNPMLETLIILSQDEMLQVSSPVTLTLETVFQDDNDCQLENLLQENLLELLKQLSCIINTNDEPKQVSSLHLLKGYLLCLGRERLSSFLKASVCCEQLFSSLLIIVELETSHVTLLDNAAMKDFNNINREDTPWKLLRHFTDTKLVLAKVEDICQVLSQCCDISLIQYLLEVFESQIINRKEIALLLGLILKHSSHVTEDYKQNIADSVLDIVLSSKVWNLPLSLHSPSQTGQLADNASQARSNIVLACLLCEVAASTGQLLADKTFRRCLFQCLYPLIERAGCDHELLSLAALQSLRSIAQVCAYTNISELIVDNIDYLSYYITLQLREGTPLVLDAIKVILEQANENVLPCIEDVLQHALRESHTVFVDENRKLSYLNMYLVFVMRIQQWHCGTGVEQEGPSLEEEDLVGDLLEYVKLKETSENFENMETDEPVNLESEDNEVKEEVKPAPKYISMIEAILNTCLHFLPSRTLHHQVLVLQILGTGLCILASHSEDVLLPLVHKVWSPLVTRLQHTEHPMVLNHAFNLFLTLALTSKDFIRARTMKEVVPSLCQFMRESAQESKLKDAGSAYRLTYKFKLQLNVLSHLHKVLLALELREKVTHNVLYTMSVYLSSDQPAPLQKAAVELFQNVMKNKMFSFVVWTLLMSLWSEKVEYKSSKQPKLFKTFYAHTGDPVYKNNITKLYDFFNTQVMIS